PAQVVTALAAIDFQKQCPPCPLRSPGIFLAAQPHSALQSDARNIYPTACLMAHRHALAVPPRCGPATRRGNAHLAHTMRVTGVRPATAAPSIRLSRKDRCRAPQTIRAALSAAACSQPFAPFPPAVAPR